MKTKLARSPLAAWQRVRDHPLVRRLVFTIALPAYQLSGAAIGMVMMLGLTPWREMATTMFMTAFATYLLLGIGLGPRVRERALALPAALGGSVGTTVLASCAIALLAWTGGFEDVSAILFFVPKLVVTGYVAVIAGFVFGAVLGCATHVRARRWFAWP